MSAPKTWDELINTSQFIYEEEKKNNNTIIRYHSSMNGRYNRYKFLNIYIYIF